MVKKIMLIITLVLGSSITMAQNSYTTSTGITKFKASFPSYGEVNAVNNKTKVVLSAVNEVFTFSIPINEFHFENSEIEEFFNKSYMESSKFSKATFKGVITNLSVDLPGPKTKVYHLIGTFTLRGRDKDINTVIFLKKGNDNIHITSNIEAIPEDFDINITEKTTGEINFDFDFKLSQ